MRSDDDVIAELEIDHDVDTMTEILAAHGIPLPPEGLLVALWCWKSGHDWKEGTTHGA